MSRKVVRDVERLLQDMDAFEMLPECVGRIGYASMQQRVGEQQIAELIVDHRDWLWQQRQQRQPQSDRAGSQSRIAAIEGFTGREMGGNAGGLRPRFHAHHAAKMNASSRRLKSCLSPCQTPANVISRISSIFIPVAGSYPPHWLLQTFRVVLQDLAACLVVVRVRQKLYWPLHRSLH